MPSLIQVFSVILPYFKSFCIILFFFRHFLDRQTDRQIDIVVYREVTLPKISWIVSLRVLKYLT